MGSVVLVLAYDDVDEAVAIAQRLHTASTAVCSRVTRAAASKSLAVS
jgi:hypothetical protein